MKERKNVFAKETVTVCDKCSGHMMYKGGGCYVCESCGEEYLTDFGKVKRFINTYGPSNAITISRETGVSRHKIQEFLRDGRVEVVEDATNKVAFCLSCGVPIRSGKYCNLCQSRMAGKASGEKGVYTAVADGTVDKQKDQITDCTVDGICYFIIIKFIFFLTNRCHRNIFCQSCLS